MASFSVCSRGGPQSTVEMYGWRKTIARCPCTPPSTEETLGEKISAQLVPVTRYAEEETDADEELKIVKSRVSRFAKLEASRTGLAYV